MNSIKPVVFVAFADPADSTGMALPSLAQEEANIHKALADGETRGGWEYRTTFNCKLDELLDMFSTNRVVVFHFGGHSNQQSLWLPAEAPGRQIVDGKKLEDFLAAQKSLQLAFFNSCSNQAWAAKLAGTVPYVIASVAPLPDDVALYFATQFYTHLSAANPSTVEDAFNQAAKATVVLYKEHFASGTAEPSPFRMMDEAMDFPPPEQAPFPWIGLKRQDAPPQSWKLADVTSDPLIGLPPLEKEDYDLPNPPNPPYVSIKGHGERDAALFFGRSAEIRVLSDWMLSTSGDTQPVSLFYGQSGVGKSSLLNAGLLPRVRKIARVAYRRRNENLINDLHNAIAEILNSNPPADAQQTDAWRADQVQAWLALSGPSLVILDQVEEALTHHTGPINVAGGELRTFTAYVKQIFAARPAGSQARLLLSFRKEYLAEIRGDFADGEIGDTLELVDHFWLDRLSFDEIVEVVTGAAYSRLTRDTYKITFPEGDRLPKLIADDLLRGDSPIATVLQIVLKELWDATPPAADGSRSYTIETYQGLSSHDNPLLGFYRGQRQKVLDAFPKSDLEDGLELDLLYEHTTQLGTAQRCSVSDLRQKYPQIPNLEEILTANKDNYLLTEPASDPGGAQTGPQQHTLALAHDTLAPLIRRDLMHSEQPGSRARRLVESRATEWAGDRHGTVLDRSEMRIVKRGLRSMRALTPGEKDFLEASRRHNLGASAGMMAAIILVPLLLVGLVAARVLSTRNTMKSEVASAAQKLDSHGDQLFALIEAMDAERISETSWEAHLFSHKALDTKNLTNLEKALTLREVYRANINEHWNRMGDCAVAMFNGRPVFSQHDGKDWLGGQPLPDDINSATGIACDPASQTVAYFRSQPGTKPSDNSSERAVYVWSKGTTTAIPLPDDLSGNLLSSPHIAPGGAVLVFGLTKTGKSQLVLLDVKAKKFHVVDGADGITVGPLTASGRFMVDAQNNGLSTVDLSAPNAARTQLDANNPTAYAVGTVGGQEAVATTAWNMSSLKLDDAKADADRQMMDDVSVYRLSDKQHFGFSFPTGSYEKHFDGIALSPDGKTIATDLGGTVDLWSMPANMQPFTPVYTTGRLLFGRMASKMQNAKFADPHPARFTAFTGENYDTQYAFSPNSDLMVTATYQCPSCKSAAESSAPADPALTGTLHVWRVTPITADETHRYVAAGLYLVGCNVAGGFIADMAANSGMVSNAPTADYAAMNKLCDQVRASKRRQKNTK